MKGPGDVQHHRARPALARGRLYSAQALAGPRQHELPGSVVVGDHDPVLLGQLARQRQGGLEQREHALVGLLFGRPRH